MWVIGIISIGLLTFLFSFLLFQLNKDSDPVFREILSIKTPGVELPVPVPVPEPEPLPVLELEPQLTLSLLLADEIIQNQVQVRELAERSIAIIQGDNLFRSGSASVNKNIIPLLAQVAQAMNQLNGQILIVGHSDNRPIRSARYPSNWHLSKARANSVKTIIEQIINEPQRISIEGRADLEPVATNSTREGRAKNRRVEIILLK
jgi:type VI secretion system protein ImpK